jgi:hypothetical protein
MPRYAAPELRPKRAAYSSGQRSCWSKTRRLPASLNGAATVTKMSGGLQAWTTSKPPPTPTCRILAIVASKDQVYSLR